MASRKGTADELGLFILRDIEGLESGEKKGAGAYGIVYEVTVRGVPCIAKRLHNILVNETVVSPKERTAIQKRFRQECITLSKLKHPNIVHFVGVHYGRAPGDVSLIMEKLHSDLGRCLDTKPNIPLSLKVSILLDVSYGLLYLHTLSPKPIIHRDLTARNILLTCDMRAKIADLGVSKVVDLRAQVTREQTKAPGNADYMPPEALKEKPKYGAELDTFSFGHLALYTATQNFPKVFEVTLTHAVIQSGELQILKRKRAIAEMGDHHCLYPLVIQCLKDNPSKRPTASNINTMLKELCMKHPKTLVEVMQTCGECNDFSYSLEFSNNCLIKYLVFSVGEMAQVIVYQQRLEEVQLMAQTKEKAARKVGKNLDKALEEVARFQQELARAQEEVRAKTSQVKKYKEQVEQLKAQSHASMNAESDFEVGAQKEGIGTKDPLVQQLEKTNAELRARRISLEQHLKATVAVKEELQALVESTTEQHITFGTEVHTHITDLTKRIQELEAQLRKEQTDSEQPNILSQ